MRFTFVSAIEAKEEMCFLFLFHVRVQSPPRKKSRYFFHVWWRKVNAVTSCTHFLVWLVGRRKRLHLNGDVVWLPLSLIVCIRYKRVRPEGIQHQGTHSQIELWEIEPGDSGRSAAGQGQMQILLMWTVHTTSNDYDPRKSIHLLCASMSLVVSSASWAFFMKNSSSSTQHAPVISFPHIISSCKKHCRNSMPVKEERSIQSPYTYNFQTGLASYFF